MTGESSLGDYTVGHEGYGFAYGLYDADVQISGNGCDGTNLKCVAEPTRQESIVDPTLGRITVFIIGATNCAPEGTDPEDSGTDDIDDLIADLACPAGDASVGVSSATCSVATTTAAPQVQPTLTCSTSSVTCSATDVWVRTIPYIVGDDSSADQIIGLHGRCE
jgi:hypothetical protein